MSASSNRDAPGDPASAGAPAQVHALLAAAGGLFRDTHVQERLGDLGRAFSIVLGSWIEPFAAAMQGIEPTARSQAAARAMTDVARLTGAFARQAGQRLAGMQPDGTCSESRTRYTELAARIDDSFRELSSSPEFDRARRRAFAAVLDWLQHDPAAAAAIARAFEPPPAPAPPSWNPWPPPDAAVVRRDGTAKLLRFPCPQPIHATMLVIPGFATGVRIFDLDPQRSAARTFAEHGVETWLLDWGSVDETDRARTVTDQLGRIDQAVDAVATATGGRRPALAGHFHGGLLALLYCIQHSAKTSALATLSTPFDFAAPEDAFADWLRAVDGERLVDVFGNLPGTLVAALIAATSPMRWCGGGFYSLIESVDAGADAARIARLELARRFPPAFPGETFRGLYRTFYRDNAFAAGGVAVLDGRRYDPSSLTSPLLNVFARDDRVVPPQASSPLGELAATVHRLEHPGGHFDLLTGRHAHSAILPDIAAWLIEHSRGA